MSLITHYLSIQTYMSNKGRKTIRFGGGQWHHGKSVPNTIEKIYIYTRIDGHRIHMKWTRSKQISRPDKRKWTQGLTQNKAPCVIVICRENNFPFYTKECHWIHLSHLRLWPMPMSVQAAQNTLHFLLILCDFGWFCHYI